MVLGKCLFFFIHKLWLTKNVFRLRGYQFKSQGGGEPKKNPKKYNKFDDMAAETLAEAVAPSPSVDATELVEHGLGTVEKP
jgi:queuine tRNA-ribosyltransferase subunit QTRTD1